MRSGQIDTVFYQLLACTAAGSGAGLLIGKEKGVLKEGRRKEKPERRIRSMGNQKAKTISNFIHWCGLQSSVIGFLKFQCAVKCRFSLIMLVCLYYKAPWFGLRL
ncbi:hypothetical protein J1N35_017822 [Gossypium stocksii]|uniref:Uncharacterized protein n=1 Tax=Gossypium stocksii TaxID=47602 RepID=A0A9D4A6H9_9ROSI|nr:hypothetical protein J1N35_017822 [Gossypium stocksii]